MSLFLGLISKPASADAIIPDQDIHHAATLVVANSKAWKPFSYIDKSGEPKGLLVDLWKEFGRVNNINVAFKLTDWNKSLELVRQGKADVHAGLLWSSERAQFLDFGNKLANLDGQLFLEKKLLSQSIDDIFNNEPLGVVKGSYEDSFIRHEFPQATLIVFDNNQEMLDAALSHKINGFIADFQIANFYLFTANEQGAFSPAKHLYTESMRPAVAKGNYALLSYVKEGFSKLDKDTLNRIQRKWLHVETVYPSYLLPIVISTAVIIIVLYIVQLKVTVAKRTKALNLANQELKLLAAQDPLTGISNRRFFTAALESQNRSRETGMTLMLFDIDKFKSVNDSYGHHIGDQALQAIVNVIRPRLCEKAVFGRIGGEEFSIFLTSLNKSQAFEFANLIQSCVEKSPIKTDIGEINITISLGAIYTERQDISCTDLMTQADLLMYRAKNQGRNCSEYKEV
ncbi:sensor domain-containing diguanylate cyclase [Shewanella sairae]|uniref:diguanylate cyclase n=2 Tax=Shewanella sairae TaxID=190310 RepID=A0ABQ4PR56_9GAMM|nr:sensor domain-containing diguanylate cyclase [Shewanella sairae]GIU51687.1 sensor domain-containing diguanylate cyclase [Shewanella sairae]